MENAIKFIRPPIRIYLIFAMLLSPALILSFYVSIAKNNHEGLFIILGFISFIFLGIYSNRFALNVNDITYYKYIFIAQKIAFKDIREWKIEIGVDKYFDRLKPTVRLEILSNHNDKIILPIKLFRKSDVEHIVNSLPQDKRKEA